MASEPTLMSTVTGYLLLPQQQDGPAPAHKVTPWRAFRKFQVAYFIAENNGLLLVICAQFIFASMDLSVKLLETLDPPTPTLELMTIRMVITAFCCTVYMVTNRISDPFLGPKGVRGLLLIRALVGFIGIFAMYYSLNYLSLADATVITFLSPFAVAFAGHLLLGESYTKNEAMAGVCSLIGVILIARPSFLFGNTVEGEGDNDVTSFQRLRAVGVALLGVGGHTGTFIVMRVIGTRAHPMHIITFFSIFCVIVGSIGMATIHQSVVFPMTLQWISLLFILGLLSVAGQLLLTLGLRYETATRSALGSYSHLLFAAVLQFIIFGAVPSLSSVAGWTIILGAQAYAVFTKPTEPPLMTASPIFASDVEAIPLSSEGIDMLSDAGLLSGSRQVDTQEESQEHSDKTG